MVGQEVKNMKDYRNELKNLAENVKAFGKVLDEVATVIAKLTLVVMAIISLIQFIIYSIG